MPRKKVIKSNTSLMESLGLRFHHDERFIFTIGFILFIIGLYLLIAFSSYFTTGEADQSLVTTLQSGELENSGRSFQNVCGFCASCTLIF